MYYVPICKRAMHQYILHIHPKITKPKGNFHLGTLCKNKQQEAIRVR